MIIIVIIITIITIARIIITITIVLIITITTQTVTIRQAPTLLVVFVAERAFVRLVTAQVENGEILVIIQVVEVRVGSSAHHVAGIKNALIVMEQEGNDLV